MRFVFSRCVCCSRSTFIFNGMSDSSAPSSLAANTANRFVVQKCLVFLTAWVGVVGEFEEDGNRRLGLLFALPLIVATASVLDDLNNVIESSR